MKRRFICYSSSKRNVYEKSTSFKGNVSVFMCQNAPSVQEEENPTYVGDPD